jgi:hypothetical protein
MSITHENKNYNKTELPGCMESEIFVLLGSRKRMLIVIDRLPDSAGIRI